MSNLMGQVGEVTFTVEIKRKDTGKIDNFDLVGKITEEQLKELTLVGKITEEKLKELTNVSDALDGSEKRSD
jgi:hypothetical protein